jgi:hypothetical protein
MKTEDTQIEPRGRRFGRRRAAEPQATTRGPVEIAGGLSSFDAHREADARNRFALSSGSGEHYYTKRERSALDRAFKGIRVRKKAPTYALIRTRGSR